MTETSPKLGLPYIQPAQAQKHVTHNEAIRELDTLVQLRITEFGTETAPGTPALGETHALGPVPGGPWAGKGGNLATWDGETWQFLTPQEGWLAWDIAASRLRSHAGGNWVYPDLTGDQLARLGIATAADDTNRLAVASEAVLFTHAGGDHRLKLNKAANPDTASLVFQSNWTGHAEMGLAGDTGFSLKVSADGSSWTQVMWADPAALQVDVPVTGLAVQSSSTDATAGRLLTVGAFGLGGSAALVSGGDLNNITVSGVYQTDASTLNRPPNISNGVVLHMARTSTLHTQLAISRSVSNPGEMATRAKDSNGNWSSWFTIYTQDTIIGAVSQSAGVPTGALIEKGSNANGYYRRFACGFQECWHSKTASAGGAATWTFPAAFSEAPVVTGAAIATVLSGFQLDAAPSATVVSFSARDKTDARRADTVYLRATGRWSALT